MEPIILRALERLLGVLIGGVAIYLGYRLFLKLPEQTDSQGKIILPGGVNIFLSRIGPGVFFALFGAALVAISFQKAVQVELPGVAPIALITTNGTAPAGSPRESPGKYVGVANHGSGEENADLAARRVDAHGTLHTLNELLAHPPAGLPAEKLADLKLALRDSKLAIVRSVWGTDWGEYGAFRRWLLAGEPAPVPAGFAAARTLFHHGSASQP